MDRIYLVLNEVQNGTKSAKQLFHKVQGLFKNNLVEFQIFLNELEADGFISFLGGNNTPKYGDIIIQEKGRNYLRDNKPKEKEDNKTNIREVYFLSESFSIGSKDVNGIFQIHISNGPNDYIAKAKNKKAKNEYEKWYWKCFNTDELRLEKNHDIIKRKRTDAYKKLAELLNNNKLYDLSIPIEKIELLKLKKEFDEIKTYPEKLAWWRKKEFYQFCNHSIFLTDFASENEKPENYLTIYPNTIEEIGLFNEFSFNESMKSKEWGGGLDQLINTYRDRIKSGANAIVFTKREIERNKNRYVQGKHSD